MNIALIIGIAIKLSLLMTVLSYGLRARLDDVLFLFRRPWQLAKALFSINVVMSVFVGLLVAVFDFTRVVNVALAALAVSPVPPILPNKTLKEGGSQSFTFGLLAAVSLFSIVLIPLAVMIFEMIFGDHGDFSEKKVIGTILTSVILPFGVGMAFRHYAPGFAERVAEPLGKISMIVLIVAFLPILVGMLPAMWDLVGRGRFLAIVAFALVGVTAGYFLGGPDPHDRAVLGLATASRHPAISIALATGGVSEAETKIAAASIVLYLLVSSIVAVPYLAWLKGREKETREEAE